MKCCVKSGEDVENLRPCEATTDYVRLCLYMYIN